MLQSYLKILTFLTLLLSLNGTYKALGEKNRDNSNPQFTDHCFTGEYPTPLDDKDKGTVSNQFSLLSESN